MTDFIIIVGVILLIRITVPYFARRIEKAHIERCKRWKKEQMEAGMSEKDADFGSVN